MRMRRSYGCGPAPARRAGFTLIELLVVVAIIALLISILLPSLSRARETARSVKCQTLLKQIEAAEHMYADANDNYFAPHNNSDSSGVWVGNEELLSILDISIPWAWHAWPDEWVCPTVPDRFRDDVVHNYGENNSGVPGPGTVPASGGLTMEIVHRPSVKYASQKVYHHDATDWNTGEWGAEPESNWDVDWELSENEGGSWNNTAYRHMETANVGFMDGHASNMNGDELYHHSDAGDPGAVRARQWYIYRPDWYNSDWGWW